MATKTEATYSTKNQRLTIMGAIQYNTDLKMQLALDYSNGRTDSLSKLFYDEASALIKSLKGQKKTYSTPRHLQFDLSIHQHRYVLSLCRQLNWVREDDRLGTVADMETLNNWLMSKKSPINKCLMDLRYADELPKIIYALEQILSK